MKKKKMTIQNDHSLPSELIFRVSKVNLHLNETHTKAAGLSSHTLVFSEI